MADAADMPTHPDDHGRELDQLRAELDAACDDLEAAPPPAPSDEATRGAIDAVERVSEDFDDLTAAIDELLHGPGRPTRGDAEAPLVAGTPTVPPEDSSIEREVEELSRGVEELLAEAAGGLVDSRPRDDRGDQPVAEPFPEPADALGEADEVDDAPDPERAAEPADALVTHERDDAPSADRDPEPADAIDEPDDDAPDTERAAEPADRIPRDVPRTGLIDTAELDDLDHELAAVSEALIQQDRVGAEEYEAPHPLGEEPAPPLGEVEEDEFEPAPAPPSPAAPAPPAAPVNPPETTPESTPQSRGFGDRLRAAAAGTIEHTGPLARRAAPHAATLVLAMSRPLESRPARLRHTLGWLALYTAFMAACVWVYIVFVRSSPAPLNDAKPADVATDGAPPAAGVPEQALEPAPLDD